MLCRVVTRTILEKKDVVKDCVYYTINSNNKYECKIALGKRMMSRCRNCYFARTNFSMCYL